VALRGYVYKRAIKAVGVEDPLITATWDASTLVYRVLANVMALILIYSLIKTVIGVGKTS